MIEINLLPKEYQKRKITVSLQKNALYVIAAGLGVIVLLAAYTLFFQVLPAGNIDKKIKQYQKDAERFAAQSAKIDSLNALKQLILDRMTTIETLDRNRTIWIDILSDLGSRIPDYLWLTEFRQVGGSTPAAQPASQQSASSAPAAQAASEPLVPSDFVRVMIKGKSFSLNSIATLLVRLKGSPYYSGLELSNIKLIEERNAEAYEFTINSNLSLKATTAVAAEESGILAGSEAYRLDF